MKEVSKSIERIPVESGVLGLQVDSRLLHLELGVGRRYTTWIESRIKEYGFVEGIDCFPVWGSSEAGQHTKKYIITIDMAKELAMVEKNDFGRTIRRYFIETEKRYRDWIGFWLPKLEQEADLFSGRMGYNYGQLLIALGAVASRSAFRSRISRNRQEFWKNQYGTWYVSEELGRNIILYHLVRRYGAVIRSRHLEYRRQRMLEGGVSG
jgi:phage anti-repressor protein